jgi:uncharacterized protein YbjQ (UPF0145 family)
MAICIVCEKVTGFLDIRDSKCGSCRRAEDRLREAEVVALELQTLGNNRSADVSPAALDAAATALVLTTGFDIPGREIDCIVDIVGAEVAISTNIFKDIANEWRDAIGGRSGAVQDTLRQARAHCFAELKREAFRAGADAIIGVRLNYSEASTRGTGGSILVVAVTGTAVQTR